jgi:hypothetical protein
MENYQCPICYRNPNKDFALSEDGASSPCPHCGEYAISTAASISVARYTAEVRREMLHAALMRNKAGLSSFVLPTGYRSVSNR